VTIARHVTGPNISARRRAIGVAALVVALVATGCMNDDERTFFDRTNALRAAVGAPALVEHILLDLKAQSWARQMASAGRISHSRLSAGLGGLDWTYLGENVGAVQPGGDPLARLHDALVASPSHREILVDPQFTHMGVGVARGPDGTVYVAEVFARLR
jgi:uncharacterized protein YkwD